MPLALANRFFSSIHFFYLSAHSFFVGLALAPRAFTRLTLQVFSFSVNLRMPRPTSTHEQRQSAKLLASQVGVREAARQLGLNENRVMQWSARYHWNLKDKNHVHNGAAVVQDCKQIVSMTFDSLASLGKTTKLAIANTTDKAARRFEEMEPTQIIDKSDKLMNITKVAATIHGWNDAATTGPLNLNVLSGGRALVQIANKSETTNENQGS